PECCSTSAATCSTTSPASTASRVRKWLYSVAFATPAAAATCAMVILVPLTSTARRAPSSNAARVRFIALPARVRVPTSRTGAAEAIAGAGACRTVDRNSVSTSGSDMPGTLARHNQDAVHLRRGAPRHVTDVTGGTNGKATPVSRGYAAKDRTACTATPPL